MSDGNGHNSREFYEQAFPSSERTWDDVRAQQATFRTTSQLSSAERSIVNDRLIAQVGELTKANNALAKAVDFLLTAEKDVNPRQQFYDLTQRIDAVERGNAYTDRRIDAIERGVAVLSAWLRRPLWERVRARFGF